MHFGGASSGFAAAIDNGCSTLGCLWLGLEQNLRKHHHGISPLWQAKVTRQLSSKHVTAELIDAHRVMSLVPTMPNDLTPNFLDDTV